MFLTSNSGTTGTAVSAIAACKGARMEGTAQVQPGAVGTGTGLLRL
ncbi:MAG: hypothetical protein IPH35_27685 [Rhodoferax sp.]|nr:hypothetical protein [Rhodoferax sp.]